MAYVCIAQCQCCSLVYSILQGGSHGPSLRSLVNLLPTQVADSSCPSCLPLPLHSPFPRELAVPPTELHSLSSSPSPTLYLPEVLLLSSHGTALWLNLTPLLPALPSSMNLTLIPAQNLKCPLGLLTPMAESCPFHVLALPGHCVHPLPRRPFPLGRSHLQLPNGFCCLPTHAVLCLLQ